MMSANPDEHFTRESDLAHRMARKAAWGPITVPNCFTQREPLAPCEETQNQHGLAA